MKFFEDLGLEQPESIQQFSEQSGGFSLSISSDQAEQLGDVDIIVTYGSTDTLQALTDDPVLSKVPAIANGAVVGLPESDPVGTAANPTPLAIEWVLEDYLALLAEAADKVQ